MSWTWLATAPISAVSLVVAAVLGCAKPSAGPNHANAIKIERVFFTPITLASGFGSQNVMVTFRNTSRYTIREIWADIKCFDEFGETTRDNHPGRCMYVVDPNYGYGPVQPGEVKTIDVLTLSDGIPSHPRTKRVEVTIVEAYEEEKPLPE